MMRSFMNFAASAPSRTLWSKERERGRIFLGTTFPCYTTGASIIRPVPRIADSGKLMIGVP